MSWGKIAAAAGALVIAGQVPANAAFRSLTIGGTASTPAGHHDYCIRGGNHCGKQAVTEPAKMTKAKWKTLSSVNLSVNRAIKPATDQSIYGKKEYWNQSAKVGDCEDYALRKRSVLLGKGFTRSQLLLAKAHRRGEAHVVLIVRTTEGDLVLDNMLDKVVPVNRSGLRFQKMQAPDNASRWVAVR